MNRDRAHATSKHQSRLRCRWTLCPFITHALNHLAVISLASGEGLCGHLTSCSLSPLSQWAKRIYSSQSILLALPQSLKALCRSSFPVSDNLSSVCTVRSYGRTLSRICSSVLLTHTLAHRPTCMQKFMSKDGIWVPWQQGTSKSSEMELPPTSPDRQITSSYPLLSLECWIQAIHIGSLWINMPIPTGGEKKGWGANFLSHEQVNCSTNASILNLSVW